MKECIFCKIINGEIPSKKIYEDNDLIVILDVNPLSNGHMLIIPKKHYTDFTELDNETLIKTNNIAKNMKDLIYKKLNADGIKLVNNFGIEQIVKHYHLHIIPSYEENKSLSDIENIYKILK